MLLLTAERSDKSSGKWLFYDMSKLTSMWKWTWHFSLFFFFKYIFFNFSWSNPNWWYRSEYFMREETELVNMLLLPCRGNTGLLSSQMVPVFFFCFFYHERKIITHQSWGASLSGWSMTRYGTVTLSVVPPCWIWSLRLWRRTSLSRGMPCFFLSSDVTNLVQARV